jgi:hypothetical protein
MPCFNSACAKVEVDMNNLSYLVAAYGVFWGLTFALVISIWVRQRRLERDIATLAAQMEERQKGSEQAEP